MKTDRGYLVADAQGDVARDDVRTRWFLFNGRLEKGERDAILVHMVNAMPVWSALIYYRQTKHRTLFYQRCLMDMEKGPTYARR